MKFGKPKLYPKLVSVNSGSWWWTGRPGVLRFMGSQRVGHDWWLIWSDTHWSCYYIPTCYIYITPLSSYHPSPKDQLRSKSKNHLDEFLLWLGRVICLLNEVFLPSLHAQFLSCVWPFAASWTARLLCPWNFPGKNTGAGCHFLLQEIFLTQGPNLCLLHWQAESLPLSHLGSPPPLYYV